MAKLKSVLDRDSALQSQVLTLLAADPKYAQIVVSLAPKRASERPWEAGLVDGYVRAGELQKAQELWRRFARSTEDGGAVTNSTFVDWNAPPPFNWQLTPGAAGLVEYRKEGGLAVIYYAREPAEFARQLILLPPGRYRLRSSVEGGAKANDLVWRLKCNEGEAIAEVSLGAGGDFRVPQNCKGQWLMLAGKPADVPSTTSVVIRKVGISWLGD
ncbi:hypothetical protein G7076_04640 [Sphingomonas sp. HDW15A]|uniref:hypothetical protein n=1 Tax=Sphingomonas sp. HDW15A TaxID=2714942 RepID=UPI00140B909B|nr:hypothetical protein [Sphingomonas sp. HDW15A]QIK95849.1 hypothetical protein G7076_04640 [Sphingomonas sp. HDW15A]